MKITSRADALNALLSLDATEAHTFAIRAALIAEERNDLSAGFREALQEVIDARGGEL